MKNPIRGQKMSDKKYTFTEQRCPCGGVILADTEDWPTPLCYECYPKRLVGNYETAIKALKFIKSNLINELEEPFRQSFWKATKVLNDLGETSRS